MWVTGWEGRGPREADRGVVIQDTIHSPDPVTGAEVYPELRRCGTVR